MKVGPIPLLESNQGNCPQDCNNLLTASIPKNNNKYYFCGYNKHPRSKCPASSIITSIDSISLAKSLIKGYINNIPATDRY